jgi:hypothetical protein
MNRTNYAIIVTADRVYKWIHWVAEAVISLLDFGDRFSDVSFAFQLSCVVTLHTVVAPEKTSLFDFSTFTQRYESLCTYKLRAPECIVSSAGSY